MSDDALDYLQPGFEPSTLTVPRLRSILVQHNVDYPSGSKKAQLVEIFNQDLIPQARRILTERARARRTSRGIIDAESSQDSTQTSTQDSEGDDDVILPPPTPRTRSVRQPSARVRASVEDSDEQPMFPTTRTAPRRSTRSTSPVKRMPRASSPVKRAPIPSFKHPRQEESETGTDGDEVPQTIRKSRKSAAVQTPMAGARDSLDGVVEKRESRRESNFTYDNPFQSGSPPSGRHSSGERKRKSLGGSAAREMSKRRSSVSRRRAETPQANYGIRPPTSSTFEIPVSRLDGLNDYDENGVEISEDFTPEARRELDRELQSGIATIKPRRREQSSGVGMRGPIWMLLITILGGYAAWYRQEKIAVGFCGVGREAHSVVPIDLNIPDWARTIAEPQCDPCPQHSYCNANYEVQCDADFVLNYHPLSLGGFLPLPPTCEPDGEKVRRVKAVADRAVEELRERRAKWECGELVDDVGVPQPTVEIGTEELKKEVSQKRRRGMGEAEFEELWAGAIGEILGRDEVVSSDESNTLTSTSLARLPLTCAIKRSFRLTLARHRLEIGSLILIATLFMYIRSSIRARAATNAAIPSLVSLTLSRLATQASLHAQDPEGVKESWISIGQLRDDVLRDEHSVKKREHIWTKVKKVVEMNANVRAAQRESKNGEISRVWEWIGALEDVDGFSRRRKSGRFSWGASLGEQDGDGEGKGVGIVTPKWEEGRPIY